MGLRRRLSKKWSETVNGVLSGPGVDVDSVNTDDLVTTNSPTFKGTESDIHWEQVALLDPNDGAPLQANVEPYDNVRIVYSIRLDAAGDIFLRANGDGASTGDYSYFDETGSKNIGQNQFLILSGTGNFASATGVLEIRNDGNGRISFRNDIATSLMGDIDGFGVSGGRNVALDEVTDISINTDASLSSVGAVRVFGGNNQ